MTLGNDDATNSSARLDFLNGTQLDPAVLFHDCYVKLCLFAQKITYNIEESRDLACTSFERLLNSSVLFQDRDHAEKWLHVTTKNLCLDWIRRNQVTERVFQKYSREELSGRAEVDMSKVLDDKWMLTEARYMTIMEAVQTLPKQCRVAIEYRIQGLEVKEIADKMGISVQSVRNTLSRSYKMLRPILPKYGMTVLLLYMSLGS